MSIYKRTEEDFYTPKRIKLGASLNVLDEDVDDVSMSEEYHNISRLGSAEDIAKMDAMKMKGYLFDIFNNWNLLVENMSRLEEEVQLTCLLYSNLWINVATSLGEVEDAVADSEAKIQLVDTRVGEGEVDDVGNPISVWEAFGVVKTDVGRLRQTSMSGRKDLERHELGLRRLEQEGAGLKGELKSMETNLEKWFAQYRTNMATIRSTSAKRGTQLSPLSLSSTVPLTVPGSVSVPQDTQVPVLVQQVNSLTQMLQDSKSKVNGLERLVGTGPDEVMFGGLEDHDPLGNI